MATVSLTNWTEKNTASVTDDSGANPTNIQKVQVIRVSEGAGTGTGDAEFSSSTWSEISSLSNPEEGFVVTDTDESTTKAYEVEDVDTSNNVAWIWVYDSWDRDNTDQSVVAAGTGDGTDYSMDGVGSNPWGSTGVNAELVMHFDEDSPPFSDSSPNNFNSQSVTGTSQIDGSIDGARDFDGETDVVNIGQPSVLNDLLDFEDDAVLVAWQDFDVLPSNRSDFPRTLTMDDEDGNTQFSWSELHSSNENWEFAPRIDGTFYRAQIDESNISTDTEYMAYGSIDASQAQLYWDIDNGTYTDTADYSAANPTSSPYSTDFGIGGATSTTERMWDGFIDAFRIYSELKSSDWRQAEWDASPKGGQTFFSWNGAQSVAETVTYTGGLGVSASVDTTIKTLTGKVQRSNTGVLGAEVFVVRESDLKFVGYDVTDSNGEYEIGIGPASGGDVLLVAADYKSFDNHEDDFETASSELNWESDSNISVDDTSQINGTYSLQFNSPGVYDLSATRTLNRSITVDGDRFKAAVKIDNQTGDAGDQQDIELLNASGDVALFVKFYGDGEIATSDAGSFTTVGSWNAGEVVNIRIEPDFSKNKYRVFINGEKTGTYVFGGSVGTVQVSEIPDATLANSTGSSGQTVNMFVDDFTFEGATTQEINYFEDERSINYGG